MKTNSILLTIIILSSASVQAYNGWKWLNPLPYYNGLTGICFTGTGKAIAVGDEGNIWQVNTKNFQMIKIASNTTEILFSVFFPDSETGWVVGKSGTLLKTVNSGESWKKNVINANEMYLSVYFCGKKNGWIVGSSSQDGFGTGIIRKTADSGATWDETPGFGVFLAAVYFIDSLTGWVAGGGGKISWTKNGGSSWTTVQTGTTQSLRAISFISADTGWAVGELGTIMKSIDGGNTWAIQSQGALNNNINDFEALYFYNSQVGYALGSNILKTTDGGATWDPINKPTRMGISSVSPDSNGDLWAVGGASTVLRIGNQGTSVTLFNMMIVQGNTVDMDLSSVYFTSKDTGWLGGVGAILHTVDNGVSWAFISLPQYWIVNFQFISRDVGWALDANGTVLKTVDGGAQWDTTTASSNNLSGMCFSDSSNGWVVGNNMTIARTTDGGATWISEYQKNGYLRSVYSLNNDTAWAVGYATYFVGLGTLTRNKGAAIHTTDAGQHWQLDTALPGTDERCVKFVNRDTGWIFGDRIFKTTNRGLTWLEQSIPQSENVSYLSSASFLDANKGWAVGSTKDGFPVIISTANGGATWSVENEPSFSSTGFFDLNSICFTDSEHGWTVGNSGSILQTVPGSSPIKRVQRISNKKSANLDFIINGKRMTFSIGPIPAELLSIEVFTLHGQKVTALYSQRRNSPIVIDNARMKRGTFIIRLEYPGASISKRVLIVDKNSSSTIY